VFGELGEAAMVFRLKQALFDGQFANGNFKGLEVANFLYHRRRRLVPVAVIVVMIVIV
jgi:hypothetical protein